MADPGAAFADSNDCSELTVGKAKEPALRCTETREVGGEDAYRVITHEIVRVVRDHKPVDVLDAELRLDMLDSPRPGSRPMLALRLLFAADGASATVADSGSGTSCKVLLAAPARAASTAAEQVWIDFDRAQETRLCSGLGSYRWKADRFQRAK